MMTLRLYHTDSYLKTFDAHVIERLIHNGQPALILDRTAFYPTAGGQPNDLGTINNVRVTDVIEREDGKIVHALDSLLPGILNREHGSEESRDPSPIPRARSGTLGTGIEGRFVNRNGERDRGDLRPERQSKESEVVGVIDWPRRFDHMQQHSGQHVLSQAFVRVASLDTVAVHIGAEENTLDLPTSRLAAGVMEQAEYEANAIVMEDRPFVIYELTDADLPKIPLRRPPKVSGSIRIVEVKDYDWSACGGTHVRNTAQIGLIKIIKAEKRGNETRVTFHCGQRALEDYSRLNTATNRLMETFSASRYELEQAVQKLIGDAKTDRKTLQEAQARLIVYEAAELLAHAQPDANGTRLVAQTFESRDLSELRALAKQLTKATCTLALLGTSGEKSQLIFACSKDARGDMAEALRRALATLSPEGKAKGGGSPDFAQGGGIPADLAQVQAAIQAAHASLS